MSVKENIYKYLDFKDITPTQAERMLNWGVGALVKANSITSDRLKEFILLFNDASPEWLLTGEGEMLKKTEVEKPSINYVQKGSPYYNVDFIGGFDLVLNDQTLNPDYYIDFAPFNKDGVVWCNLTGHSMEPELSNGDYIAMKEMTDPIEYLPYGEVYGFITNSYRTVKRMGKSDKDGFIRLIPTNKSPEYSDQDIPISMIRKVYAVLGSMHRLF